MDIKNIMLMGFYHYEFIEARTEGKQWRVGDHNDLVVTDFPCEDDARNFVNEHNLKVAAHNHMIEVSHLMNPRIEH